MNKETKRKDDSIKYEEEGLSDDDEGGNLVSV